MADNGPLPLPVQTVRCGRQHLPPRLLHRTNKQRLAEAAPFLAQTGGYQTAIISGIGEVDGFALQYRLRQLLRHLLRVRGVGDLLQLEAHAGHAGEVSLQTELAVASASGFITGQPQQRGKGFVHRSRWCFFFTGGTGVLRCFFFTAKQLFC